MSQITRKDSCVRNDAVLIGSRAHNFPESIRQLELGKDKHVVNGDFLDEFYHAPKDQRQSFIDFEPPQSPSQTADRYFYAYCAAEAEKLAHDFNLTVPLWVERQYFFLEKPDYAGYPAECIPHRLRLSLEKNSPFEFARRNLFVTSNVLERY